MPAGLVDRYSPEDLSVFTEPERARFLAGLDDAPWESIAPRVAWELLYRIEPGLYERLIAGEHVHPRVLEHIPQVQTMVEVAAGTGRLTADLVPRCARLIAVEPAAPLRELLESRGWSNVQTMSGFFDDISVIDGGADVVVSCSAFTSHPGHGGEPGLAELERITAPGGRIVLVWPADVDWLRSHGFEYQSYPGEMAVDFGTVEEALELASIFYPHAVDAIAERGGGTVPYEVLGINPPRDVAWKDVT